MKWFAAGIVLVILATLVWHSGVSWEEVRARQEQIEVTFLLMTLLLTGSMMWLGAWKWSWIVADLEPDKNVAVRDCFYYVVLGVASIYVVHQAGNVAVRGVKLSRDYAIPLPRSLFTIFVDQLLDGLALLLFLGPALLFYAKVVTGAQGLWLLAGIFGGILLVLQRFHGGLGVLLAGLYDRLVSVAAWVAGLFGRRQTPADWHGLATMRQATLTKGFALGVTRSLLGSLRLVAMAACLQMDVSFQVLVFCYPLIQSVTLLSVTPGGAGMLEAGIYGILLFAGVAPGAALFFAVMERLVGMLEIFIVLGMAYLNARKGVRMR